MNKDKSYSGFVTKIMLVGTIIIIGVSISFMINKYFNEENITSNDSSSKELVELVNKLYGYVTYGRTLQPMYYFFRNNEITNEEFSGLEKMLYAFQLADKNNVINLTDTSFTISSEVYNGWVREIFGSISTFDNSKVVTLHTNDIFKNSVVTIEYNQDNDQYEVNKIDGFIPQEEDIKLFYSNLYDYSKDITNGTITIKEKFIFVSKEVGVDPNKITGIKVYKDIYHKKLIDEIENPTTKQINSFGIDNYLDDANIITYTFKLDSDGHYYFYSSKIAE